MIYILFSLVVVGAVEVVEWCKETRQKCLVNFSLEDAEKSPGTGNTGVLCKLTFFRRVQTNYFCVITGTHKIQHGNNLYLKFELCDCQNPS